MAEVRKRLGAVEVRLAGGEATLLANLCDEVGELLTPDLPAAEPDPLEAIVGGLGRDVAEPQDPALLRLLPDAYGPADSSEESQERSAEWRRHTDADLRSAKTAALRKVGSDARAGNVVRLDRDEAREWAHALNDIRLVIGERLFITDDWVEDALALPDDDPRRAAYAAYDWLTFVQDRLVSAVQRLR